MAYLDAFAGAAYPMDRQPGHLLAFTAKQLPGYGGNLETAASDLAHYQKMEFSSLVLLRLLPPGGAAADHALGPGPV